jgi:hypothetical protein
MDNLTLSKADYIKLYNGCSNEMKTFMEEKLGKELFTPSFDFLALLNEYADDIIKLGEKPNPPFQNPTTIFENSQNAGWLLDLLARIIRKDVPLIWTPGNSQKKYYAWFDNYQPGAGFRLVGVGDVWTLSNADGGARLFVLSLEQAKELCGEKYLPLWNQFLNPNNK